MCCAWNIVHWSKTWNKVQLMNRVRIILHFLFWRLKLPFYMLFHIVIIYFYDKNAYQFCVDDIKESCISLYRNPLFISLPPLCHQRVLSIQPSMLSYFSEKVYILLGWG